MMVWGKTFQFILTFLCFLFFKGRELRVWIYQELEEARKIVEAGRGLVPNGDSKPQEIQTLS